MIGFFKFFNFLDHLYSKLPILYNEYFLFFNLLGDISLEVLGNTIV